MPPYRVDLESLRFNVPPGLALPELAAGFYAWAAKQEEPSLGWFELAGERLDDLCVEDGTRRADALVSFLTLGDGARIGWWRPDGEPLERAGIALLGHGDLAVLSSSLGGFLRKLATGPTGWEDLDELEEDEGRRALSDWLDRQGIDEAVDTELGERTARLEAWFAAWSAERIRHARASPHHRALAASLKELVGLPDPAKPWERTWADVVVTSKRCELLRRPGHIERVALPGSVAEPLRAFRDLDVRELPEAGLWYRAWLELDAEGTLLAKRTYLEEPPPGEVQLSDEEVRLDAIEMPRSRYWLPPWMERRLERRGQDDSH